MKDSQNRKRQTERKEQTNQQDSLLKENTKITSERCE